MITEVVTVLPVQEMILPLLIEVCLHLVALHPGIEEELVVEAQPVVLQKVLGIGTSRNVSGQAERKELLCILRDVCPFK